MLVGDLQNQRVLIWNDVPTTNRPADAVLGARQPVHLTQVNHYHDAEANGKKKIRQTKAPPLGKPLGA